MTTKHTLVWLHLVLGAITALGLSACFNPSYEAPRCGPDQACPAKYTCVADVCVRNPGSGQGDPDGGVEPVPDAPPVDAPPIDAPPAVTFPSCVGLAKTCGNNGDEDCCTTLTVPGGTYFRSYEVTQGTEGQTAPATVSTFRLDKYEVTVGRFRTFLEAGMGTQQNPPSAGSGAHARIADSGWDPAWVAFLPADRAARINAMKCAGDLTTWTDVPGNNETRPINCLSWYTAMAFCIWDGGYLPTEAEWNYAAAGGDQHRVYPWSTPPSSTTIDSTYASYQDATGCTGDGLPACTLEDLVRVGSKPAGNGRWGHSELGGNAYEWVLDFHTGYVVPCTDCAQLTSTGTANVVRGGCIVNGESVLRPTIRPNTVRTASAFWSGVRCARPVN